MSLAGGTALALQIGHRISVDLDFFGKLEVFQDEVLHILTSLGSFQLLNRSASILSMSIRQVKVDIVNYSYDLIRPINEIENIPLYSIQDIGAMKIAAITGRGRKRDFYDLFFLLQRFSLEEILGFYSEKYPDGNQFLALKSLTYFADAEKDENPVLIDDTVSWEEVKYSILQTVS